MIDIFNPAALRAEAERRQHLRAQGRSFAEPPTAEDLARQERDANVLEKKEQLEVSKRFRVCGFTVRNLSQPRASKQSPGFPDLWLTNADRGVALWWESKRQVGGKYSDAQLTFRRDCERCGVRCLGGDRYDAERWLVLNGFATMGHDGQITPLRTAHAATTEGV